ncbi:TetR/AcrR family transcriptional regulator [Georgenia sp. H159]|uniref:TetR/AcrR family transcriptional regulator n=1 Tax=Georgenia sp. H159 TaxID=3076115 RepID=UPI002D791F39|nr:TetR/AcrR family transcriptional regulator [Georgenia sp. H159]
MPPVPRLSARDRLLGAADTVLFDRGIRATPVDELLRHAEVSAATMYAHFGSKDALVAEALRQRLADWRRVWDEHVVAASDDLSRLLAVFDALASYRRDRTPPARWCAFLATATEHPDGGDEISEVLTSDTALLTDRLLHLSRPLAGERAQELADDVLLAYNGTLAAFLRGHPDSPVDVGRRVAESAARVHLRG